MCSATDGATPVYLCTWAASAIFSYGSRGTPGWAKTLKRVPELPKAQDGSSMRCRPRTVLTAARSTMVKPALGSNALSGGDVNELDAEQVGRGSEFRAQVAEAERPVVGDAARAPRVGPLTGVATEVDAGGGVADLQQWPGYDRAGRRDEP